MAPRGLSWFFVLLESLFVCELGAHTNFRNPTITLSWRFSRWWERKRKNASLHPLGPKRWFYASSSLICLDFVFFVLNMKIQQHFKTWPTLNIKQYVHTKLCKTICANCSSTKSSMSKIYHSNFMVLEPYGMVEKEVPAEQKFLYVRDMLWTC